MPIEFMTQKYRPILMSAPMVRAILDGTKTQTRRMMKPQPPKDIPAGDYFSAYNCGPNWNFWTRDHKMDNRIHGDRKDSCQWTCPYGQTGEMLWVKETFGYIVNSRGDEIIVYRADGDREAATANLGEWVKWKSSIFMPRAASRITLEVTGLRGERLLKISEDDAEMEGIDTKYLCENGIRTNTPFVSGYKFLWDSIHGRGAWWNNPFVWVISFRMVKP